MAASSRIWRTPILGELFRATNTRPTFRLLLRYGNRFHVWSSHA